MVVVYGHCNITYAIIQGIAYIILDIGKKGVIMDFSESVKRVREIKGYSQEQLANELNVSFATINRWENRKTKPSRLALFYFMEFCRRNNVDFLKEDGK